MGGNIHGLKYRLCTLQNHTCMDGECYSLTLEEVDIERLNRLCMLPL